MSKYYYIFIIIIVVMGCSKANGEISRKLTNKEAIIKAISIFSNERKGKWPDYISCVNKNLETNEITVLLFNVNNINSGEELKVIVNQNTGKIIKSNNQ